jgi:hypothetical protein
LDLGPNSSGFAGGSKLRSGTGGPLPFAFTGKIGKVMIDLKPEKAAAAQPGRKTA